MPQRYDIFLNIKTNYMILYAKRDYFLFFLRQKMKKSSLIAIYQGG